MRNNKGIELLRIILMMMVVFLHLGGLNVSNRVLANTDITSFNGVLLFFLTAASILAVNVYVIISGYFGVYSKFKLHKVVNYWLQGVFFTVVIFIFFVFKNGTFIWFEFFKQFLIISTNQWWFLSCFIFLALCKPFLNVAITSMEVSKLKKFMVIIFVVTIIYPDLMNLLSVILRKPIPYNSIVGTGFNTLWFIVLYIIGGAMRRIDDEDSQNQKMCFNVIKFFVCVISIVVISYVLTFYNKGETLYTYYYQYTSIFVVMASIYLFRIFKDIQIKNKVVLFFSSLSKYSFGVYLLHEHPAVRIWLEENLYCTLLIEYKDSLWIYLIIFVAIIVIFIAGIVLDFIREKVFTLFKINTLVKKICKENENG